MKEKRRKKNFWQKLRAFIIRPKFTRYFFARMFARGKKIKIELDKRDIKRIGQAVSQEIAKVISEPKFWLDKLVRVRASKARRFIEPQKIEIKESFIDPTEEAVKFKSSFSKEPKKKQISGAGLEKSLRALKKISD
ncbi:hypothetical protein L6250_01735 [Candidatus Parcubacteria bacterium]|nr:hypothetical protein [Patescibacteria group bacterium]MCG2688336.1 hypothetical protein [Candidatus Parcubacteria bacterium]